MACDTRERILERALEMFAEQGYKETNLRDLAQSLGISKSAIYKHFKSKEDIRNVLVDEMDTYYNNRLLPGNKKFTAPESTSEFESMVLGMVDFTIHDKNIILVRKMLTTQQFKDEKMCKIATRHFLSGLENTFTKVFTGMVENGLLVKEDPKMLAFSFTTPISALVHLCDREPTRDKEIMKRTKEFTNHFIKTYGVAK